MGLDAMLAYRCVAVVGLVATLCAAQEAQWLQLEARPELEAHMDGVSLAGPYFDCQCSLDMKCLCDKTDDFTESFLEIRDTSESFLEVGGPAEAPKEEKAAEASSSSSGSGSGSKLTRGAWMITLPAVRAFSRLGRIRLPRLTLLFLQPLLPNLLRSRSRRSKIR